MGFQRLRGFKDLYGREAALFRRLEDAARKTFEAFGFEEIRTPLLEEKELFARALGTETDVVQKEMYEFEDRSKERVAMRPEGTAGVVRAYLENHLDKTQGLCKFYYAGPMFRSERPQAGRLRQFHQIGVEILGTASPYADAEAIQCLASFLERAGAGEFALKLNNLGTLEERAAYSEKILKPFYERRLAELCEDCRQRFGRNLFRLLDCKQDACRGAARQAPSIAAALSEESRRHFEAVQETLTACGVRFTVEERLVRGLDYYTKTVFEVSSPKLGAQDALGAGGRYDRLIESFGGAPSGAVGFAVGVERLALCVADESAAAVSGAGVFLAALGGEAFAKVRVLAAELRRASVRAAFDYDPKSLKSQMRLADKTGARYAVILGEDEIRRNEFVLKNLSDGTQESLALDQAVRLIREKVERHA